MGVRDALAALLRRDNGYVGVEYKGPDVSAVLGMSAAELYRTQPHLRTVISFRARNVAQLGMHSFRRLSDTDRVRVGAGESETARLLSRPNAHMTTYELVESLVSDHDLYGWALWHVSRGPGGVWEIAAISPDWVSGQAGGNAFSPDGYWVTYENHRIWLPISECIVFKDWNPGNPKKSVSTVDSLKQVIAEQIHAWSYRQQIWERGGRVGAFITRPKDAPAMSAEAKSRFEKSWRAAWSGDDGPKAGGTPLLDEGMEIKRLGFNAKEDQWIEAAKLSLSTVASAYHINPTMVGLLDNANYSNVREFRSMLYGDSLGPLLAMIEDRVNSFLVPMLGDDVYVEFNIAEKMQGNFEEQAGVMSTLVGRPIFTANEGRAMFNRPAIEGGDELIIPLNVIEGGQSSPRDSGSQNEKSLTPRVKAEDVPAVRADPDFEADVSAVLVSHFERQRAAVMSALGAKGAPAWWDGPRWDAELSADLEEVALSASEWVALRSLRDAGIDEGVYSVPRTRKFLAAVAASRAGAVNAATLSALEEAILDPAGSPAAVFDAAVEGRSGTGATAFITTVSAFAMTEAASQAAPGRALKTWVVTSGNPRSEHASMNGETVPVDETFSNGANWPGDPVLGAEGVANCLCGVEISYP